ncbi:MAG: tetratricopeptide repeat protein [Candidatus Obscuribacterales bacterium]|nr:tetratricopeptide repeat protein [Candidatus Obscuribacterales bacterium]
MKQTLFEPVEKLNKPNLFGRARCGSLFFSVFGLFALSFPFAVASGSYHFDRALQYQFAGNPEAAVAEYRQGLKDEPESVDGHTRLGVLLLDEVGDADGAISEFVTALTIDPQCRYCQSRLDGAVSRKNASGTQGLALGNDLYRSGQLSRAVAAYSIASQAEPKDAELRNCLAWTLYRIGKLDEALFEVNTALRLKPNEPEYVNTLACILFDRGDLEGALRQWKRAIADSKTPNPADLYGLAVGFFNKGERDLATKNFKDALKLDANYANLDYLRNKIGLSVHTLASHDKLLELAQ